MHKGDEGVEKKKRQEKIGVQWPRPRQTWSVFVIEEWFSPAVAQRTKKKLRLGEIET